MLPGISGVDVIKEIRARAGVFEDTHHRVFQHLPDESDPGGLAGGANKCLSKSSCTPKDVIDIVRNAIGDSGAMAAAACRPSDAAPAKPGGWPAESDAEFQTDLRKAFIENLPGTLLFPAPGVAGASSGGQRNGAAQAGL